MALDATGRRRGAWSFSAYPDRGVRGVGHGHCDPVGRRLVASASPDAATCATVDADRVAIPISRDVRQ